MKNVEKIFRFRITKGAKSVFIAKCFVPKSCGVSYKELTHARYDIKYWRTLTGLEVDFVINRGKIAIESKITTPIEKRGIKGIIEYAKEYKPTRTIVVSNEPRKRIMTIDGIEVEIYPIEIFLKELWSHQIIVPE